MPKGQPEKGDEEFRAGAGGRPNKTRVNRGHATEKVTCEHREGGLVSP